jgi:hypothetical protein
MNRAFSRHVHLAILFAGTLALLAGPAFAQPEIDLTHGVLIVHAPITACYSLGDWPPICTYSELQDCASQNNDNLALSSANRCWFVIAAFMQESQWCAVEFGIEYEETAPSITGYGFCVPSNGLEIPGIGWPAPDTGTSIATTDVPWTGNFLPVYWFTGYSYYGPGVFQLTDHPGTPSVVAFANCVSQEFPAECFGALGFGEPGSDCCPPTPIPSACCLSDGTCILTDDADECIAQGGNWFPGLFCDQVECPALAVCCVDHVCYFVDAQECAALGGVLHPEYTGCVGEPCEALTPAAPTSWGAIKATFK